MSMLEWAKNEVAIASKRERGDKPEGEWDYGCACYDSAMRAFESLLGDGHSGMSIGFTKNILNRLIDGKPLTPIEDTEEVWGEPRTDSRDKSKQYQCKRMRYHLQRSLLRSIRRDRDYRRSGSKVKLKSNRFAVIPVMCSHCKRYVWMEPYRSGETWNRFIDRFVKIRLCNECVGRYGVGGTNEKSNN